MKPRVFLDTNILISGIFFEGNESKILDLVEVELITCEDVVEELYGVVGRKLKYLRGISLEVALAELGKALLDLRVVPRSKYRRMHKIAGKLMMHRKDIPILAAVLYEKPDYFLTGDSHFFSEKIKETAVVMTAKEFLKKLQ